MSESQTRPDREATHPPGAGRGAVALALATVTAAFFAAGYQLPPMLADGASPPSAAGAFLPDPRPLPAFVLSDQHGRAFSRERLVGRWTLVVFGHTRCTDVCPMALDAVRAALDASSRRGVAPRSLQAVFVSVDPARDTPARLEEYLAHFDARIVGLTGDEQSTARLAAALGIAYERRAPRRGGDYTVDHTAAVLLVGPRAHLLAGFPVPFDAVAIAEAVARAEAREAASGRRRRAGA